MRLLVQPDVEQRFWDKVEKLESGCWCWKGGKTKYGYGIFGYKKGKTTQAHRYAYSICCETIPDGVWIVRKSFCPTPGCCNPDHLMKGNRSIAVSNGFQRGTFCPPDSILSIIGQGGKASRKLTPEQIKETRTALSQDVPVAQLAQKYQVSLKTIYSIKNNKHYRDV